MNFMATIFKKDYFWKYEVAFREVQPLPVPTSSQNDISSRVGLGTKRKKICLQREQILFFSTTPYEMTNISMIYLSALVGFWFLIKPDIICCWLELILLSKWNSSGKWFIWQHDIFSVSLQGLQFENKCKNFCHPYIHFKSKNEHFKWSDHAFFVPSNCSWSLWNVFIWVICNKLFVPFQCYATFNMITLSPDKTFEMCPAKEALCMSANCEHSKAHCKTSHSSTS